MKHDLRRSAKKMSESRARRWNAVAKTNAGADTQPMASERSHVDDSFWNGEVGFVCNRDWVWEGLPCGDKRQVEDYGQVLHQTGRLPDLSGAPIASWVLARCAFLCGKRFPFSFEQVYGSDGGDYNIGFFVLSKALKPVGGLYLLGDENRVFLGVDVAGPPGLDEILEAFTNALVSDVTALKKTHLTVVYTSVDDPNYWKRLPYVFGWSGRRFLGYRDPEHAIDPSEFE